MESLGKSSLNGDYAYTGTPRKRNLINFFNRYSQDNFDLDKLGKEYLDWTTQN